MKFFAHEINSRTDDRIFELIDIHGLAGYGFFWVILEELYGSEDTGFQIEATNIWMKRLARSLNLTDDRTMTRYFDTLADLGLIDKQLWHERIIYSQGVMQRADPYMARKAKEAEKKRTQRAQANKSNNDCPQGVPKESPRTKEMSLGTKPMSQDVPVPYTYPDPHSHSQADPDPKAEENTRGEDIYMPPVENFLEPCQPTQEVLISGDMAEEKETPIPPTPLASLPPENVGLAIAGTEKPKKRKRNVTSEDLIPFRDVWNSDAPAACVRFKELTKPDEKALRRLIAEHGDRSLEIFQDGLGFARTQKWWNDTSEGKSLSITNYISKGKPEDYAVKYRGLIERGAVIPNTMSQSNTDRPMTASDIRKAETYLKYKEALTA